jgi:hypothetical protein
MSRWALGLLELATGLSAIGGAIYGLSGAKNWPLAWLQGSPFHSYLIPSLVLLVAVAGSAIVSLAALVFGYRRASDCAIGAGAILVGWIAVEVIIIPSSWLQPSFFAVGIAMIGLGWDLRESR